MPDVGGVVALIGSQNVKGIAVIDVVFRETNRIDPFPSTVERERNIT